MNLASALLHQIISLHSLEAWGKLRPNYLPGEFTPVYRAIDKHYRQFLNLPSFDELKLGIRDSRTLEKVYAIEAVSVDADPVTLLEYLKNEYTQQEVLFKLDKYIESTILIDNAEETLEHLQDIVVDVRNTIDIEDGQEPMQSIDPLYSEEEVAKRVPLGFNQHFDATTDFGRTDLIMVGGVRGSGKSITCANIVGTQFEIGKTAQYFSIEMEKKPTMQRIISASTGLRMEDIEKRKLDASGYLTLAKFQASRFVDGEGIYEDYLKHLDYDKFHKELTRLTLKPTNQFDIVYDPALTTAKIRAEVERLKNIAGDDFSVVAVDYLNQIVRRDARDGQYDWKEQIEVSKELKRIAQDYEVLMFVPYQIDASGEARFSKGILDKADGSFVLNGWTKKDKCLTFKATKMRGSNDEAEFTSEMDWDTLKIGPQTALSPAERKEMETEETEGEEEAQELAF